MSVTIAQINRYGREGHAFIRDVSVTVAPVALPVGDAIVKEWLRIDTDDTSQDDVIEMLMDAATEEVQGFYNVSLINQTRRATFDYGDFVELPYGPVNTITAVEEQDATGTWAATTAYTNAGSGLIEFHAAGIYRVTYTAGFGANATAVPQQYATAILRHFKAAYEERMGIALGMIGSEVPGMTWRDAAKMSKKYHI